MDLKSTNLVAVDSLGNLILWKIFGPSSYTTSGIGSPFGINLSTKVRTNPWNTNFPAAGNFIAFSSSIIYQYDLSLMSYAQIFNTTNNITIINSCFGANVSELFILVYNSSVPAYQVLYFLSSVLRV